MNLESALRGSYAKADCDRIVSFIGDRPDRFAMLMKLFFGGASRITQRAAWPMSYCVRNHPALAGPYFKKMLDALEDGEAHPAVRRNIVRLLQYVRVPARHQGRLMSCCFRFISMPAEKAAVKAFSLTILENMLEQHPGILPEIRSIIEDRWDGETPAFRSRAAKIMSKKPSPERPNT